jgi:hypothetical protein
MTLEKQKGYSKFGHKLGRKGLTIEQKERIIELRQSNLSIREVSYVMKLSVGVVHKVVTNHALITSEKSTSGTLASKDIFIE